jgi:hypothetical protein
LILGNGSQAESADGQKLIAIEDRLVDLYERELAEKGTGNGRPDKGNTIRGTQ